MKKVAGVGTLVFVAAAVAFVDDQAIRTLRTLTIMAHERDGWQRPDDIIAHLNLQPGQTVVDLGSGAGYFALKMAARVAPSWSSWTAARATATQPAGVPITS